MYIPVQLKGDMSGIMCHQWLQSVQPMYHVYNIYTYIVFVFLCFMMFLFVCNVVFSLWAGLLELRGLSDRHRSRFNNFTYTELDIYDPSRTKSKG